MRIWTRLPARTPACATPATCCGRTPATQTRRTRLTFPGCSSLWWAALQAHSPSSTGTAAAAGTWDMTARTCASCPRAKPAPGSGRPCLRRRPRRYPPRRQACRRRLRSRPASQAIPLARPHLSRRPAPASRPAAQPPHCPTFTEAMHPAWRPARRTRRSRTPASCASPAAAWRRRTKRAVAAPCWPARRRISTSWRRLRTRGWSLARLSRCWRLARTVGPPGCCRMRASPHSRTRWSRPHPAQPWLRSLGALCLRWRTTTAWEAATGAAAAWAGRCPPLGRFQPASRRGSTC